MSSIGSGPGIGSGPTVEVKAVRALSAADQGVVTSTAAKQETSVAAAGNDQSVVASTTLSAGAIPVDAERVATIKKAVESGSYPIIPTKISDAMIAAGMLLRVAK